MFGLVSRDDTKEALEDSETRQHLPLFLFASEVIVYVINDHCVNNGVIREEHGLARWLLG
jgi:hypothetical protein